jgi:hypothetical protein
VVGQIKMIGNRQTIILRDRLQVLSKSFTEHQTCFNILLLASRTDNGVDNVAGGTGKATLDSERAKRER